MARDPYAVLGVAKDASTAEIKKSYRKLAKLHHPDLQPGDAKTEQTFKEISQANTLLGDENKRARYDAGGIGASGQQRPQAHFHDQAATGGGFRYTSRGDAPDLDDLFASMFGARGGFGTSGHRPIRGQDIRYALVTVSVRPHPQFRRQGTTFT